ncbi:MAG TPA: GxGYxYP domain-containing protein [Ktedonobacteraceae bacterium]|nr:GxGYxYP domain-containing protein [Ktedonobacteraceae bacterium]
MATIDTMRVDWSAGHLLPAFQPPQELIVYNVHRLDYDLQLSIATLVGLINRSQASVYLDWRDNDLFWLREVLDHVPSKTSTLTGEAILSDLLKTYRDRIEGYVIYNPKCIDSVNVATMIGSQRNGFVVSPTMADILLKNEGGLPIIDDMREYNWVSRSQVYRWALENLFADATPGLVAGLNPETAMGIRPYLAATKAFIYWLNPVDILPRVFQGWRSERSVLKSILRACPLGAIHLGWFQQEGSGVTLTSSNAIPVVASDYFSNLETWSGVAREQVSPVPTYQNTQHTEIAPQRKVYVSFTMSEGDNLQYIQERMLHIWRDPQRGTIPIGWPMAVILEQAAPAMWNYYLDTASANDEFIAAPSGLAYSYPSKWPQSKLTSYLQQTGQAMQRMHLSLLEILDSNFWLHPLLMFRAMTKGSAMVLIDKNLQQYFARDLQAYGLKGILSGGGLNQASWSYSGTVPIFQNVGMAGSINQAVTMIRRATKDQCPYFINVYVLAWQMGPAELKEVAKELGSDYEIVTPGTLLRMLAASSSPTPRTR